MIEKEDIQVYNTFRKKLLKLGFYGIQYSIYVKVVLNEKGYQTITRRIQGFIPPKGNIRILKVTEKQYESMLFLRGTSNLHEVIVGDNEIVKFRSNDE